MLKKICDFCGGTVGPQGCLVIIGTMNRDLCKECTEKLTEFFLTLKART